MNVSQYAQPPRIPLYAPSRAFDVRPVALHGQEERGMPYQEARKERIPDPDLVVWTITPKVVPLPGYTENIKQIYEYPEVTGAIMKPPALVNEQVARVSPATYEVESEQVLNRLAGVPPILYNRQWDESYYRYEY